MRLITLLAFGFLLFFVSCNQAPKGPTIALVTKTSDSPYFNEMREVAQKTADSLGLTLISNGPQREYDIAKQTEIIENLIQRGVDVLCIVPCGSREIVPVIKKANKANIPVIIVDTRVDEEALNSSNAKIETFIGSDNYEGGVIAGKYLVQLLNGKGKVAMIEGVVGHETNDNRKQGFKDAIKDSTGIELVTVQSANWERDKAYNVCQNILLANPDIDGIFTASDLMGLGALKAIEAENKLNEIALVSFDALPEAQKKVKEGKMRGTVAQFPGLMGETAILQAHNLLNGQPVEKEIPVKIELIK